MGIKTRGRIMALDHKIAFVARGYNHLLKYVDINDLNILNYVYVHEIEDAKPKFRYCIVHESAINIHDYDKIIKDFASKKYKVHFLIGYEKI
jgi:hypothetical protein